MAKKKAAKKKPSGPEIHCKYDKLIDPKALKDHPANPATHPEVQVELLGKIIKAHGIRHEIIVSKRSGYIVAGHCRKAAAILLGLKEYPVVYQAYKDEAEELAVLVADNKIQEFSEIDGLRMADIMVELDQVNYPLELTAMVPSEIKNYVLGPIEITEPTDPPNEDGILARIRIHCPAGTAKSLREKLTPIVEEFDGARFA